PFGVLHASARPVVFFVVAEQPEVLQLLVVGRARVPDGIVVAQRIGIGKRSRITEPLDVFARVGDARIASGRHDAVDADVEARLRGVAACTGTLSGPPRIAVARQVAVTDVGPRGVRPRDTHVFARSGRQVAEVVAQAGPARDVAAAVRTVARPQG